MFSIFVGLLLCSWLYPWWCVRALQCSSPSFSVPPSAITFFRLLIKQRHRQRGVFKAPCKPPSPHKQYITRIGEATVSSQSLPGEQSTLRAKRKVGGGFPLTSTKHDRHMCFLTVAKSMLIRPAEKSTAILYLSSKNGSTDWPTHQNYLSSSPSFFLPTWKKFQKQNWDHDSKKKLLFPLEDRWRTGTEKGIEAQKLWSVKLLTLENKQNILQYNLPVCHGALRAYILKYFTFVMPCLAWLLSQQNHHRGTKQHRGKLACTIWHLTNH